MRCKWLAGGLADANHKIERLSSLIEASEERPGDPLLIGHSHENTAEHSSRPAHTGSRQAGLDLVAFGGGRNEVEEVGEEKLGRQFSA